MSLISLLLLTFKSLFKVFTFNQHLISCSIGISSKKQKPNKIWMERGFCEACIVFGLLWVMMRLSILKLLKGPCERISWRFVSDRRITYKLLYIPKKAMSHCSTSVDIPKILQLRFIFNPVVIYLGVCFLGAWSAQLKPSFLLPPVPFPGGLDERKCGTSCSHKVLYTVLHLTDGMKITVLYLPPLTGSKSLKLFTK